MTKQTSWMPFLRNSNHNSQALQEDDRTQLEDIMSYHPDSAGGLMHVDVVRINENSSCRDAIKLLQNQANVEMAFYLYIETDNGQLVGVLSLRRLLLCPPSTLLRDIMITDLVTVAPTTSQEEVAELCSDMISSLFQL